MSTRRSHPLRWVIIGVITLAVMFGGTLVVSMLLVRQADEFSALQQSSAEVTKTPVVTSLPLSGILSPQWFHQLQNYDTEFADQRGGIANRLGNPLPPTQVVAKNTGLGNRVLLQWSTPLGQAYDGIEIYRAVSEVMADAELVTADELSAAGYYFDTGVENKSVYYYYLRSYRGAAADKVYSDWSDIISVIPTDDTPPAPPLLVSVQSLTAADANKATAGIVIAWTSSTSSDTATYRIYRSAEAGRLGTLLDEVGSDVTAARDTEIQAGVTYYYTVTAVDGAGNESATTVLAGNTGHSNPFIISESTSTNTNTNGN